MPCVKMFITWEQDTSQIPPVSFGTLLLPSQTCCKGHKRQVLKHLSSLWKNSSSLRLWDTNNFGNLHLISVSQYIQRYSLDRMSRGRNDIHCGWKPSLPFIFMHYKWKQNSGGTGWAWAMWQDVDAGAKLWDVDIASAEDNAEPNSCSFPISVQDFPLELAFCLVFNDHAKMLLA